ncbi:MAG: redox-regulated ATPase YchF, partial [Candidatus Krumholzibacteria bacterium]|nr:redox-regulated ATPase YchF [Candidatus Krumholzibacteria bacterium]
NRLERLKEILKPRETIPTTVTFIDIAGLVKGASRGEGLGNKFLHHIREANVLAHVLRCFEDENVSNIQEGIDPVRDLEIVETELFLADLERVETFLEREKAKAKAKKKDERKEIDFLESLRGNLSRGERAEFVKLQEYQEYILRELQLLTMKPRILVLNAGEKGQKESESACREVIEKYGEVDTFVVSAKLEAEIAAIPPEDREDFMKELGIDVEARSRFIEKSHELLGLIRYYTSAHEKLQSWSIKKGTTAPEAAGKIHSDMEKGFIRAEIMSYDDIVSLGSRTEIQHHGLLRTEGHKYVVQDGDVIKFLFNP